MKEATNKMIRLVLNWFKVEILKKIMKIIVVLLNHFEESLKLLFEIVYNQPQK